MSKWISVGLVFIWMGVLFYLSNQPASESGALSSALAYKVVGIIQRFYEEAHFDMLLFDEFLRKCAHFSAYTVIAILFCQMFKAFAVKGWKFITFTFILSVGFAVTDEFHQTFVDGRTAQLSDLLTDMAGVCLGIALFHIVRRARGVSKAEGYKM